MNRRTARSEAPYLQPTHGEEVPARARVWSATTGPIRRVEMGLTGIPSWEDYGAAHEGPRCSARTRDPENLTQ
jgi:hypothetical protein